MTANNGMSLEMNNILMNAEMAKAILDGRKVQTRRVVNGGFLDDNEAVIIHKLFEENKYNEASVEWGFEPKYKVDDVLWVREPARVLNIRNFNKLIFEYSSDFTWGEIEIPKRFIGEFGIKPKWITNRHGVPNGCIKEMARIFLKITDVMIEKLHDCYTFEHLEAEGIKPVDGNGIAKFQEEMQDEWQELWNGTAPKGCKWEDNPYVFVYEFEIIDKESLSV